MNNPDNQDLLTFAKRHLDQSVGNLAPDTLNKLRVARSEALSRAPERANRGCGLLSVSRRPVSWYFH